MSHRAFTDSLGRTWEVWNVQPEEPADGWLVFETKGDKRRLTSFPEDWEDMSPERLEHLCETADEAPPSRRLIE